MQDVWPSVHQDLNCRTAWLNGTRDGCVIYDGYAFNVIKKEGNLEGMHGRGEEEEGRELTRSSRFGRQQRDEVVDVVSSSKFGNIRRQVREMVADISTSGRPPPALPLCL
jgi:hypothetical protein